MVVPFLFAAELVFAVADSEEAKNRSLRRFQIRFFNDGRVRVVDQ
jgi:hypothetical protein